MVVQRALDNLKDKPKEDKQVVALSLAGTAVVILLIGWAFLFFKGIQGEQSVNPQDAALDILTDTNAAPAQQTGATYDTSNTSPFGNSGGN